jgi:hypothetical protein
MIEITPEYIFFQRVFREQPKRLEIDLIAREVLGLEDLTEDQVYEHTRYLAANFFEIFGIKKPRTSKAYDQVILAFMDSDVLVS